MRTLKKNNQKMYFSNPGNFRYIVDSKGNYIVDDEASYLVNSEILDTEIPVYETDDEGNVIYQTIDGVDYPVEIGNAKIIYGMPYPIYANISYNSGETQIAEYGLNTSDYDAVIVADKGKYPFDERTLIWHTSKPRYDEEGYVLPESADYRVVAVKTSLNLDKFILKKRVDDD